jgi:hypothetical protein
LPQTEQKQKESMKYFEKNKQTRIVSKVYTARISDDNELLGENEKLQKRKSVLHKRDMIPSPE